MCRELLSVGVWRESRWKDPEEKYVLWEQVRKGIRIHLLEGRGERIKKQNSFFFFTDFLCKCQGGVAMGKMLDPGCSEMTFKKRNDVYCQEKKW